MSIIAEGNITLSGDFFGNTIRSEGPQQGGNISITSNTGEINATAGNLDSYSTNGNAGNVMLDATGNIATQNIRSQGDIVGGNIDITTGGSFTTTGTINSYASNATTGEAGDVNITANSDITLGGDANNSAIRSEGATVGGNISITSNNGEINANAGNLDSYSAKGTAGSVNLDAATGIDIANIRSEGDTVGGSINITSDTSLDFTGSTLNSYSETGEAGDVSITANGNITLGGDASNSAIRSDGAQLGGNISITSTSGEINATAGNLDSYSTSGTAGNVTLDATGNIATQNIRSEGYTVGGKIDITTGGTFTTTGTINSYASDANTGNAGDVNITANSNITLGGDANNSAIRSEGATVGGNISITTTSGAINANAGNLDSYSAKGTAGSVNLDAATGIDIANIRSDGDTKGGSINITSDTNLDFTGSTLNSYSETGEAGDVSITANGNITLGGNASNSAIRSEGSLVGGNISITSNTGEINATAGNLDSYSTNGTAGNVTLESAGNIATSNIRSQGAFLGGNIDINTGGTFTTTGTINSYASNATAGEAGDVNITADGNITLGGDASNSAIRSEGSQLGGNINITTNTGEIDATAGNLDSYSINGTAGNVILESAGNIATSNIRSEGASVGGNIDITTGGTFTTTGTINSYASNATTGEAGDVNVTANGNITLGGDANNSAIRSEGSQLGGNISITTNNGEINATAGNLDSYSTNGTAGNVTLESAGNIATASIRSDGQQTGGIISITSNGGAIDTTGGDLSSYSDSGTAGNVILNAGGGNVTTGNIDSKSPQLGGKINITSAGDLDTSLGDLLSFSTAGTAGDITLYAAGCVTTGDIRTDGAQIAGTLSITSCSCGIDTSLGTLTTYSTNGTAGDVILDALNGVTTGDITSYGNTASGNVNIQSDSGNISTNHIQTISPTGVAGNVTLNTFSHNGDILTANITSQGGTLAGDISVKAPDGSVTTGDIASISQSGDAGDIDVEAGEDVETGDITSSGGNNSGDINVNSDNGSVTTENIATVAKNGDSGDVALGAWEQILTGDITSAAGENSGDITVSSSNAGVTTENIATVAQNGDSGNVTVSALDNVQTGNITSAAGNNSGDITVSSSNAGVTTENLTTVAQNGDSGNVGVVALDDIQTGDITSVAGSNSGDIGVNSGNGSLTVGNLESGAVNGDSGNIALSGFEDVTAGNISSVAGGNSGDIDVNSTTGGIVAGDIESQAASGMGGNISFDADQNINTGWIISNGAIGSGDINLTSANGTITTGEIYTATGKININYPGQVDSRNMLANLAVASSGSSIINADALVASLEQSLTGEYSEYFGGNLAQKLNTTASIRESLSKIAAETGYKSAIIYVMAQQDQLELILFLGTGNVIRKAVPEAPREQLMATVEKFRQQLTVKRLGKRTNGYLQPSQQLYQWLIAPIEPELQAAGINTLLFSMDVGLRSLPMAALHDGHQFLVEKYSMSLIPSMSLIDPRYQHLKDTRVLGMGASNFQDLGPLPAVPVELSAVTEDLWQGDGYLNETFTRNNLVEQRQNNPYPIIHLATHGEFQPGLPENSYIQLWGEEKLRLDQLRELGWNNPPVELLVLSACRTALGDEQAELGFAGFAVAAGVKTALASLWYVSDEGSLALMTEFYRNLEAAKIKGEALRQAQLAMIRGDVNVTGGNLRNSAVASAIALPPELAGVENHELSHPYYWSAFTMIGSPW
ncbi:MAG TPA: CHAT domain-containing protein [Oscillatoriaceae cyanobacterium M33_DOE_052]|nr:CHAT domain-containing protein [Oscillatoriaceae cyanobacterium M33_DOE_052]